MASLVLGSVGALVGGAIGGPIGANLGWSLGSMLGSSFEPGQKVYGPRLGDLKVTGSSYGGIIPIVYSTTRIAGNVIFSSKIKEKKNKKKVGGKGGPSQTQITYTYSVDFAVGICEGPITGIRKIWANGNLIYDASSGKSLTTVLASSKIASNVYIYTGTPDQEPNSIIQSYVGVEETPAFRDTCYIVFQDFQLENYGNRLPNLEFEVVNNGTTSLTNNFIYDFPSSTPELYFINAKNYTLIDESNQFIYVSGFLNESDYNFGRNNKIFLYNVFPNNNYAYNKTIMEVPINQETNLPLYNGISLVDCNLRTDDGSAMVVADTYNGNYNRYFMITTDGNNIDLNRCAPDGNLDSLNYGGFGGVVYIKKNNNLYISTNDQTARRAITLIKFENNTIISYKTVNINHFCFDMAISSNYLYILDLQGNILKYDLDLNFIEVFFTYNVLLNKSFVSIAVDEDDVLFAPNSLDRKLYKILGNNTFEEIGIIPNGSYFYNIVKRNNNFYTHSNSRLNGKLSLLYNSIEDNSLNLYEVVSKIVDLSGLNNNYYDVTDLENYNIPVHGYVITNRMSTRQAIEPLMQAYFFDAVDSDGKIKFIKRGKEPTIEIKEDDLSASIYGSDLPDNIKINRKQQFDLADEITIKYMDINASYQIGTQYSRRLITDVISKETYEFPLSLYNYEAKNICDIVLYSKYEERTTFTIQLSNKYIYLDPNDVVILNKNNKKYYARVIDSDYQNNILSISLIEEDYTIYNLNKYNGTDLMPEAQIIPTTSDEILTYGPTNIQFLDIPILRDQDDNVGFYVAASEYYGNWDGCQVYKSIDGGSSYNPISDVILNSSIIGNATTVLNNFTSGNIIDNINNVLVNVNDNELSSISEISLLNGANVAILGNELIQFKNATLISTGVYKLTGLIRGKFGTEWAMNTHTLGERFVILSPNTTYLFNSSNSEYNLLREYKAVTFNTLLDNSIQVNFTNTGVAQKPYSPVQVSGGRDSLGNANLRWIRRSRINASWNNFTDIPIGESSEIYSIDILNNLGIIKRTINNITTNNYNYTKEQQIEDFGTIQNNIYFKVYQVSSTVGRGYPAYCNF